jgi:hypothetical protein
VAVGSDGAVMSIGSFGATVQFGSGGGTELQSAGQGDAYIWKLAGAAAPPAGNPNPPGEQDSGEGGAGDATDQDGSGAPMPPAPVPIDNELPVLEPGQVIVIEDGVILDVDVRVEDDTDLVVDGTTFDIRMIGGCTQRCPIDTSGSSSDGGRAVLSLEEDGSLSLEGSGFKPGSRIDVWVLDGTVYLGSFTVSSDGTFAERLSLTGVLSGSATLQINGLSLQGALRSTNLGVTINTADTATTSLPSAGGDLTGMLQAPILLLFGGLLMLAARRQRRA